MRHRILTISKENSIQNKIIEWLKEFAEVYCTSSMHDALFHLTMFSYHLIVIEAEEFGEKTQRLIQTIRKLNLIPIMIIVSEDDKERFMYVKEGADIIISDSENKDTILLYAYALIRRHIFWNENNKDKENILHVQPLVINGNLRKVFLHNDEIVLTKHEFDFLFLLASAPRRVYTFGQIYEIVWNEEAQGDINNIIWCFTHRLRKKLKAKEPGADEIIKCIKNVGYYLEPIQDILKQT